MRVSEHMGYLVSGSLKGSIGVPLKGAIRV